MTADPLVLRACKVSLARKVLRVSPAQRENVVFPEPRVNKAILAQSATLVSLVLLDFKVWRAPRVLAENPETRVTKG